MALNAYLKLKGAKQGDIKGDVTLKGREDSILVYAFHQEVVAGYANGGGTAIGKTTHTPVTVVKHIDKSSPLLHTALATGEFLTQFELKCFRQVNAGNIAGIERNFYTIRLTQARIVSIKTVLPDTRDPNLLRYAEYEELSFIYDSIEWNYTDGNVDAVETKVSFGK